MLIYFDPRGHKDVFQPLADIAQERTLAVGDCFWLAEEYSYGIEAKTPSNLMASVVTLNEATGLSQFYVQLQALTEAYDIPILLIYGVYSPTKDGYVRLPGKELRWRYSSLECLLLDAFLKGVLPLKVPSAQAASMVIRAFYEYSQKEGRRLEMRKPRLLSYGAHPSEALRLVCSLPEVNLVRAERLLDQFRIPLAVFNAGQEELRHVRGIGRVVAKKIYLALREEVKDEHRDPTRKAISPDVGGTQEELRRDDGGG